MSAVAASGADGRALPLPLEATAPTAAPPELVGGRGAVGGGVGGGGVDGGGGGRMLAVSREKQVRVAGSGREAAGGGLGRTLASAGLVLRSSDALQPACVAAGGLSSGAGCGIELGDSVGGRGVLACGGRVWSHRACDDGGRETWSGRWAWVQ